MTTTQKLLQELENEAMTTRKMLALVPTDKFDWQPHPRSMKMVALATHIAELPGWVPMTFNTSELDFATNPYKQETIGSTAELLTYFDNVLASGKTALENGKDEDLTPDWTLRNGEHILTVRSKEEVIRMTYCQIVHHRAQLGVFLRLLDIPIPGSYGPSADEIFA